MLDIKIHSTRIYKELVATLEELLQYVKFDKNKVTYSDKDAILKIQLERYDLSKKRNFLFFADYSLAINHSFQSILIINDIKSCAIRNNTPDIKNVKGRFLLTKNNDIYIGSLCEHDNKYGIDITINSINIELKDLTERVKGVRSSHFTH